LATDDLQIRQSYAYAVARIRQLENRLLDRSRVARMLEAPTAGDVLRILGETEYAEAIGDLPPQDYERMLAMELDRVYRYVSEFVPDPLIVEFFRLRHDLHNCKVAFRARHLGIEGEAWSSLGTVHASTIRQAISGELDLAELPQHVASLLKAGLESTATSGDSPQPVDSEAAEVGRIDPQVLDMALDRAYFACLLRIASRLRNDFVAELCRIRVDLANMTGFLRCRRLERDRRFFREFFIDGGTLPFYLFDEAYDEPIDSFVRTMDLSAYGRLLHEWAAESGRLDDIAVLERLGRRHVLEFSRASRSRFFGPEPIVAYLLWKETEVNDLRAIMVGKVNGLDAELIRGRLSGGYA
jgi:V/A-type H+-transporting ATPase subunit C